MPKRPSEQPSFDWTAPVAEPPVIAPQPTMSALTRCVCGDVHPASWTAKDHATEAAWLRTKVGEWVAHADWFRAHGYDVSNWRIQDCLSMLQVTKAYAVHHEAQAQKSA